MLVLGRHLNERIMIDVRGVRIVVTITAVRGNAVRIGFEAPDDVTIHREEIMRLVEAERRQR